MASVSVRVTWYANRSAYFTKTAPQAAHQLAAQQAAGAAADKIASTYTGSLQQEVSRAKPLSPLISEIGSRVHVYAAMENWGGTISAKSGGRLLIRGRGAGASGQALRSTDVGNIVASAYSVEHRGKGYLAEAVKVYLQRMPALLKAMLKG